MVVFRRFQVKSSEFRLVDKRPKLIPVAYHRPAGQLHFQIRSSGLEGTNDVANVDTGVEVRFREEHGRFPVLARACARVGMGSHCAAAHCMAFAGMSYAGVIS